MGRRERRGLTTICFSKQYSRRRRAEQPSERVADPTDTARNIVLNKRRLRVSTSLLYSILLFRPSLSLTPNRRRFTRRRGPGWKPETIKTRLTPFNSPGVY